MAELFRSCCQLWHGIIVRVWKGEPYDSDCSDWIGPLMEVDELRSWIATNTPSFEQQAEQDRLFDEILVGFQPAVDAP